jgi:hypothetical protein
MRGNQLFASLTEGETIINYERLILSKALLIGSHAGLTFYEHPTKGDEVSLIAVNHEKELAAHTGYYSIEDIRSDYE